MNYKNERGPDNWVRRRPRALGPGGRFIRDAAGNAIWVRTRATDPPRLVIDPALLHSTGTVAGMDDGLATTDHLLPVLIREMTHNR